MATTQAEDFLNNARYCIMLAEQAEDPDLRDHLLTLVRAWLAAAKEAENEVISSSQSTV
jgi:hypothetical protein